MQTLDELEAKKLQAKKVNLGDYACGFSSEISTLESHVKNEGPESCHNSKAAHLVWRYIPAKNQVLFQHSSFIFKFLFQHSSLIFNIEVFVSTFKFYFQHSSFLFQHSSFIFNIQVFVSTFKFYFQLSSFIFNIQVQHSSFVFNIQVLFSTFKFWFQHSSFCFKRYVYHIISPPKIKFYFQHSSFDLNFTLHWTRSRSGSQACALGDK